MALFGVVGTKAVEFELFVLRNSSLSMSARTWSSIVSYTSKGCKLKLGRFSLTSFMSGKSTLLVVLSGIGGLDTVAAGACLGLIFLNFGWIAPDNDSNISFLLLSGHLTAYSFMVLSLLCELSDIICRASNPAESNVVITVALIE